MTPFDRTPFLRIISSTAALTLLAAVIVFVLILISSAGQLSHASVPATVHGPLGLFELQKEANPGGGYQASIALLPGTWVYSVVWFLSTVLLAWSRLRRTSQTSNA